MSLESRPGDPLLEGLPESLAGRLEIIAARALGHPEDVRDAVQETLARAVEAIRRGGIPPGVSVGAYVHGIARHVIADVFQRRARERATSRDPDRQPGRAPSPLDQLVRSEEQRAVREALARLSPEDQDLLMLCYVEGDRLVDIATRLGEPPERIRKRKSRALRRLREALGSTGGSHVSPHRPIDIV